MKIKRIINIAKLFTLIFLFYCPTTSCGGAMNGIPEQYRKPVGEALAKAGDNRIEIERALRETPGDRKEGMAFLIACMPQSDLTALKADYLLENVRLAYDARNHFAWAGNVPDELFLNDVLPYANATETRDEWRGDFYVRFAPYVEDCRTLEEAARKICENVHNELKVEYNTARRKADQSPAESLEQSIASCTGLSILLTDALRSVGIPSRLAGTNWSDDRGNHTWSEVWIDGAWYFAEYYFEDFNKSWLLASAGQSIPGNPRYAVHAASYAPTGYTFYPPWNPKTGEISGYDVSERYIGLHNDVNRELLEKGGHTTLRIRMFRDRSHMADSDGRVSVNVDVFQDTRQVGGGRTAGPRQDMNDVLELIVEKEKEYTLKYFPGGREKVLKVKVGAGPAEVALFP